MDKTRALRNQTIGRCIGKINPVTFNSVGKKLNWHVLFFTSDIMVSVVHWEESFHLGGLLTGAQGSSVPWFP